MNTSGWLQLALYVVVLLLLAKPLGALHGRGLRRPRHARAAHRRSGSSASSIAARAWMPTRDMSWIDYALAMLWFNLLGALVGLCAAAASSCRCRSIRRTWRRCSPDSSFNTATSFATNTNWQGYGGESTMSYLTQMLGLGVQNFVSAAIGHGGAGGADPRVHPQAGRRHRQFLVRPRALDRLHPAAAVAGASRWCW